MVLDATLLGSLYLGVPWEVRVRVRVRVWVGVRVRVIVTGRVGVWAARLLAA